MMVNQLKGVTVNQRCVEWRNVENKCNNPWTSSAQVKRDTDGDDRTGDNEEDLSNISLEFR